jgi:hypothetical protein
MPAMVNFMFYNMTEPMDAQVAGKTSFQSVSVRGRGSGRGQLLSW